MSLGKCLVKCRLRKKQENSVFTVSLCFLVAGLEGSGLLQAGRWSHFMEKGSPSQPHQTKLMGCRSPPETWRGGNSSCFLPRPTPPGEMAMAPLISKERFAWKTSPGTLIYCSLSVPSVAPGFGVLLWHAPAHRVLGEWWWDLKGPFVTRSWHHTDTPSSSRSQLGPPCVFLLAQHVL